MPLQLHFLHFLELKTLKMEKISLLFFAAVMAAAKGQGMYAILNLPMKAPDVIDPSCSYVVPSPCIHSSLCLMIYMHYFVVVVY